MPPVPEHAFRLFMIYAAIVLPAAAAVLAGFTACSIYSSIGTTPGPDEEAVFAHLPNYADGYFRNLEPSPMRLKKAMKKTGLFSYVFHSDAAPETFRIPQKPWRSDLFGPNRTDDFSVYWLGHSSLIVEMGGRRFATDPVFGSAAPVSFAVKRYCEPPMRREDLPELDFILISHDHYDHLEYETIRALRDSKVLFITALGVGARLRGWGIPKERIVELNWGESTNAGGLKVTACTARHFSGRGMNDRYKTLWASWVIEGGGKKLFFGGDSAYGKHFKKIGDEFGPFDLVCLEIDAWNENWPHNHMFPAEFPLAAADLKAKMAMPIHWGVFDLAMHPWKESITKVGAAAAGAGLPLFTPMMGEKARPGITPTADWWSGLPEK